MPGRDNPGTAPALRPAREADQSRIATILRDTWISAYAPRLPAPVSRRFLDQGIPELYVGANWQVLHVAELGDRIAGFLHVEGDFVRSLHVDPADAGKGCGRALMTLAESMVAAAGHKAVRVDTETFNTAALAFYRRIGYRETGRKHTELLGAPVTLVLLEKAPTPPDHVSNA